MVENKRSPWSAEPDAPGVLIGGTPPASLGGGSSARTAQALQLALDEARHGFAHTFREAIERQLKAALRIAELGGESRALWDRVEERWRAVARRDANGYRDALHPRYAEWLADDLGPRDREQAVADAIEGATVLSYELAPKAVDVHHGRVGIVHYAYVAATAAEAGPEHVEGRRTETYVREDRAWLLVSSSGAAHPL